DSGPVSGVTASMFLGAAMGEKNVITTDMGGTSFDVSIIHEGKPAYSFISNTDQYEYFLPKVDLQAIGAGGGSLVRVRPETRTMTVGPDSAGAFPGPVCYGRGGQVPTVTDAQVVLGYLDPDNFAGGRMKLDRKAAEEAIAGLARTLGMKTLECAAGICRIVELQMADVIRKVTVEKGYDPRDFVLFAFGGAGPAHAGVFARELGVRKIVIPQRKAASAWCAFGAAAADVLHIFEHSEIMPTPVPAKRINDALERLERKASQLMKSEGIAPGRQRFEFSLDVRHRGQINEVEVPLESPRLKNHDELHLRTRFVERYEKLYGRGSALAGAQLEIVVARLRARALTPRPKLVAARKLSTKIPAKAVRNRRQIYWPDLKKHLSTPVVDGERLVAGNRIRGPAIIETSDTSVVVHPKTRLRVDALGNFELSFG
ncbi:MAG TPA: hydantoinase/oxoprolinase family protein, partial [Burkholderiales bacterium]|nr:hydantoinase/oxoprolinase family protein [Burkholderiales bacterium]